MEIKYNMKYFLKIMMMMPFILTAQSTEWNEYKLKEHWKTNGADVIEGIYEAAVETSDVPKYKIACLKKSGTYNFIYLQGAVDRGWSEGDVKAYLTPTATPSLYKTNWYMGSRTIQELYTNFETGFMNLIWADRPKSLFVKLYPSSSDNISKSINSPKLASGSGFVISSNGIIVTNYHVIDGVNSIKVRGVNSDFGKTYKAKILVSDKHNDLALIQIDDYNFTSLASVPFTIKTSLTSVGENIFVLGYPLRATMGDEIKLTNGIVSSKTGFQGDITSYQISAPVQPGNSGGPLFDKQGNLIGVINSKHTGAENVSYGVKSSYLTGLIELLPNPPKLQTINLLTGKSLTQQVELVKKFVYIIETE